MSLTDPRLLQILIVISVLTFLGIVIWWRKFAKNGVWSFLGRIFVLLLLNVMLLGSIGLALNGNGNFYTSWQELIGKQAEQVVVTKQDIPRVSLSDLDSAEFTADGSAILKRLTKGETSKVISYIYIVIPPSFVKALRSGEEPSKSYRVIEYLPGFPGKAAAWIHGMKIGERQDESKRAGKLAEVIAVAPEINVSGHLDAECMNIPNGPQVENWLAQDVPKYVNQFLSLEEQRWGIAGYSTGAWCATMLSLRHPNQYQSAAAIAGFFFPIVPKELGTEDAKNLKKEYDLFKLIAKDKPSVNLYIVNSINDNSSHAATNEFLAKVPKTLDITEVILAGAGHNFQAWKQTLAPMLAWFGNEFKMSKVDSSK